PSDAFEQRSLAFFLQQAMPILSGYFDSHFSSRVLPQLMHKEPAIRHAVVAVSSFYEQYMLAASHRLPVADAAAYDLDHQQQLDAFALRQYNKAIEHLTSPVLSHPQHVMNVTLIACFLFVCVEFLRGNRERALAHLKSGLNILSNRALAVDHGNDAQTKAPSIYQYVEDELTQIFVRLNVQSSLFGESMAPLNPRTATQTSATSYTLDTFSNILEARTCLDYLLSVTLRFIREHSPARYISAPSINVIVEQLKLDAQLCRWSVAFERLVKGRPESSSKGAIVLRVQHKVSSIWLKSCLVAEETIFDKFGPDFETIVSNAELLYQDSSNIVNSNNSSNTSKSNGKNNNNSNNNTPNDSTTPNHFFFDMAIIPPLYFVAIKCRHPSGRRKAISLLVNSRHVEGMWNAFVVGKAAELVMAFEEEELAQRMPFALPSEAARIHDTSIEYTGANSCLVTCRGKPNGIMGNWEVRQREIRW
ncbi:hypothetical protein F5884DRAFT_679223, partial [Xylogone sp. PMI_703]